MSVSCIVIESHNAKVSLCKGPSSLCISMSLATLMAVPRHTLIPASRLDYLHPLYSALPAAMLSQPPTPKGIESLDYTRSVPVSILCVFYCVMN
jgi:hypothetical protein